MTTSRVYRAALDLDRVKAEFRKFAGSQFDPDLTPLFLEEVVGDGSSLISQPVDEPLEGLRARALRVQTEVFPLRRQSTQG